LHFVVATMFMVN